MKRIEIIVQPDGQTKIETFGFAGADCQEATRIIERSLGQTQAEELKPEFHHVRQSREQQTRQG